MSTQSPHIHRPHRRVRRWFAAVLITAIAWTTATTTAHAGTYKVYLCRGPDGLVIPLPSEVYGSGAYFGASAVDTCMSGGSMRLTFGGIGAPDALGAGFGASWNFFSGTPIRSIELRRAGLKRSVPGDFQASPAIYIRTTATAGAYFDVCWTSTPCTVGAWDSYTDPANNAAYVLPDGTNGVSFYAGCLAIVANPARATCANDGAPRLEERIWQVVASLVDSRAPAVSNKSGTLLQSGVLSGDATLSYSATDSDARTGRGAGLFQTVIAIDGRELSRTPIDFNGGLCADLDPSDPAFQFRSPKPCADYATPSLGINTRRIPDGNHKLTVTVVDAAGNESIIEEKPITVDNVPPPANLTKPVITGPDLKVPHPGDVLAVTVGVWKGAGLSLTHEWQRSIDGVAWSPIPGATGDQYSIATTDVGRQIRVLETARSAGEQASVPSDATETVDAGVVVASPKPGSGDGGNGAGGNPSTAQLVVDREQRTVDVKHGAKIVITGRLVDADSQPIANAEVDVFEQLAVTAATWKKIGTIRTDSQGGYLFRPRTTASRRLRFAYSDRRDESNYRATREVFVSVTAGMSITSRKKVLRRHGLIQLRGRVVVDSLPVKGTWIEVQVLDAGVWRTVATRRTSGTGLWKFRHRLRQSAGITFKFRARLRPAGDVPSAEARSAPVRVRVR